MEEGTNPVIEAGLEAVRDAERARWTGPSYKWLKRGHRRCFAILRLRRMRARRSPEAGTVGDG